MSTIELRKSIHGALDNLDERFLRVVHAMLKEYTKEKDFTLPGKPMSSTALKQRVKKAKARVRSGKYISQESLEREMETW